MKMRMLLIDVKACAVKEIFCEGETLKFLQEQVGGYVDCVRLGDGMDLWVNDEGMVNGTQEFFMLAGAHQPYAGNGVIASSNEEGETIGTNCSVEAIEAVIHFTDRATLARGAADVGA